jgi:tetratricopeptide (TPR) repeat protein
LNARHVDGALKYLQSTPFMYLKGKRSLTIHDLVSNMSKNKELEFHRETARKCFNKAWNYFDKKNRDTNDEEQMLHLAHAARYHWALITSTRDERMRHIAVSDWQISRVYATLKQAQLAIRFAKSALEVMQENNLSEILHTGYEGMARAYAVAKNYESAKENIKKALEQLSKAPELDAEDKKIYSDQIRETQELIK